MVWFSDIESMLTNSRWPPKRSVSLLSKCNLDTQWSVLNLVVRFCVLPFVGSWPNGGLRRCSRPQSHACSWIRGSAMLQGWASWTPHALILMWLSGFVCRPTEYLSDSFPRNLGRRKLWTMIHEPCHVCDWPCCCTGRAGYHYRGNSGCM